MFYQVWCFTNLRKKLQKSAGLSGGADSGGADDEEWGGDDVGDDNNSESGGGGSVSSAARKKASSSVGGSRAQKIAGLATRQAARQQLLVPKAALMCPPGLTSSLQNSGSPQYIDLDTTGRMAAVVWGGAGTCVYDIRASALNTADESSSSAPIGSVVNLVAIGTFKNPVKQAVIYGPVCFHPTEPLFFQLESWEGAGSAGPGYGHLMRAHSLLEPSMRCVGEYSLRNELDASQWCPRGLQCSASGRLLVSLCKKTGGMAAVGWGQGGSGVGCSAGAWASSAAVSDIVQVYSVSPAWLRVLGCPHNLGEISVRVLAVTSHPP